MRGYEGAGYEAAGGFEGAEKGVVGPVDAVVAGGGAEAAAVEGRVMCHERQFSYEVAELRPHFEETWGGVGVGARYAVDLFGEAAEIVVGRGVYECVECVGDGAPNDFDGSDGTDACALAVGGLYVYGYEIVHRPALIMLGVKNLQAALAHLLHEPAGGGCGAADTDASGAGNPFGVDFRVVGYQVGARVGGEALREEHLAVGALLAADEEDRFVARGEEGDARGAVGHLTADGVMALHELGRGGAAAEFVADAAEAVERLCSLRIEGYGAREIDAGEVRCVVDHYGRAVGLAHEAVDFGMSCLAVDDNLGPLGRVI